MESRILKSIVEKQQIILTHDSNIEQQILTKIKQNQNEQDAIREQRNREVPQNPGTTSGVEEMRKMINMRQKRASQKNNLEREITTLKLQKTNRNTINTLTARLTTYYKTKAKRLGIDISNGMSLDTIKQKILQKLNEEIQTSNLKPKTRRIKSIRGLERILLEYYRNEALLKQKANAKAGHSRSSIQVFDSNTWIDIKEKLNPIRWVDPSNTSSPEGRADPSIAEKPGDTSTSTN
jgi:endonuclease III